MANSQDRLPEDRRMEIFAALVEIQDKGVSVAQSRRDVAARFELTAEEVARVEQEGMEHEWPPLS